MGATISDSIFPRHPCMPATILWICNECHGLHPLKKLENLWRLTTSLEFSISIQQKENTIDYSRGTRIHRDLIKKGAYMHELQEKRSLYRNLFLKVVERKDKGVSRKRDPNPKIQEGRRRWMQLKKAPVTENPMDQLFSSRMLELVTIDKQ